MSTTAPPVISLGSLLRRFWRRVLPTWTLVLIEGLAIVAMPLVIGWAVDDLLDRNVAGLAKLAALCLLLLFVGAGRRFYDTRAYAEIFRRVADELVHRERGRETTLSKLSARSQLFGEFTAFLEEAVPDLVLQLINLVGTLIIIGIISPRVLVACGAAIVVTALVYGLSQSRLLNFNRGANDELERQVDVLANADREKIGCHFKALMSWRIKLSDLETMNFSLIWLALTAVLLYTVWAVTASGELSLGEIISAVMYVFGFAESVMAFPLYYQHVVRLQEISLRLGEGG